MRFDNIHGTFADVMLDASPDVAKIAYKLRDMIEDVYPDVVEIAKPAEQHAVYAIELNKVDEIFGYLCPRNNYVRLGFYFGTAFPDPGGLLLGTGKRLRHIKVYTMADAERPEIRGLVEGAVRERQQTLSA
jgi:hypothetical protein